MIFRNVEEVMTLSVLERRLLLVRGDILFLSLVAIVTCWHTMSANPTGWEMFPIYTIVLVFLSFIWMTLSFTSRCYHLSVAEKYGRILLRVGFVALTTTLSYAAIVVLDALLFTGILPKLEYIYSIPAFFLPMATLVTSLWRSSYVLFFANPRLHRRVVVLGERGAKEDMLQEIRNTRYFDIVAFLDPKTLETGNRLDTLQDFVELHEANEIIVTIPENADSELLDVLMQCAYERNTIVKPLDLVYEEMSGRVPIRHLSRRFPVAPWSHTINSKLYDLNKRLFDMAVALIGMIVFLPIMPLIALAVYLDDPGPVFYKQERLGKGGKIFWVYKFRSMIVNAEKQGKAVWASKEDPRITRVGKFIRRTRLDEIPQIWNVFKGDMSIVGPRPERPQFVEQLQKDIPFYRARLMARPGLTGWAQINYSYGNTIEDSRIKLEYDLYYLKHQSLLRDLAIILRTIGVVLAFKGT